MTDSLAQTTPVEIIDNRYLVVSTLGSGANGKVVLVKDKQLDDSLLALKLLYPHLIFKATSFARFRTETRVTMQLAHPNILPAYGMGRTADGVTYLKLAWNDGSTLENLIADFPNGCDIVQTVHILGEMAKGMDHAHRKGVIHRDLKPANVLLSTDGRIRISDFGLAQMIRTETSLTGRGDIIGTPQYIAPEVMRGELADSRADIYAFGVITYELLTGKPPYSAESFWELADSVLNTPIPDPRSANPRVPDALAELVMRCLAKDRHQRHSSFNDLLEALSVSQDDSAAAESLQQRTGASTFSVSVGDSGFHGSFAKRMQQNFHGAITKGLWACGLVLLPFLPPHLNDDAREKYAIVMLFVERQLGQELQWLRPFLGTPLGVKWPTVVSDPLPDHRMFAAAYVRAGYPPNQFDQANGVYPLHGAIRRNDAALVESLIRAGADVNVRDRNGSTPLLLAAEFGAIGMARNLLAAKADPNLPNSLGFTALSIASERGRVQLIRLLANSGADPSVADSFGSTPLHKALRSFNPEAVKELISHGADPSLRDAEGRSVQQLASRLADPQLRRETLLELGVEELALQTDDSQPNYRRPLGAREY